MADLMSRVMTWMAGRDTGMSSKTIAAHMCGGDVQDRWSYPSDPADLGRCLRLLELFPEWKPRIGEMACYGTGWGGLVPRWDELAQSMADEVGVDWEKGREAPKTFKLMQDAIANGYRNDPNYDCTFAPDGHLRSATRRGAA